MDAMTVQTVQPWSFGARRAGPPRVARTRTFAALTAVAAILVVVVVLQLDRAAGPRGSGGGEPSGAGPLALLPNADGEGAGATKPKGDAAKEGEKDGSQVEEGTTPWTPATPSTNQKEAIDETAAPWGKTEEELAAMPREEREEYHRNVKTPYVAAGDHVRLYTTHGMEFGDRMLVTAEAAYRRAHQFFGRTPKMAEGQKFHVFVVSNTDEYNELGSGWNGDEKSSAFYAFATPWMPSAMGEMPGGTKEAYEHRPDLATVTQFSQAESLTEIYVTHATVEQFARRLIGDGAADPAPRWFVDGVASYLERWQQPALFDWSRGRLGSLGGAPSLKSLLGAYAPNEQNILSGGVLIAFLKSDVCPDELRSSFQAAVDSVNDGKKVQKTFRGLEKEIVKHEEQFKEYVNP